MLKILVLFLLSDISVSLNEFSVFYDSNLVKKGLISSSRDKYSYISKRMECQKLEGLKSFYDEDITRYIAKPKVEKDFETKVKEDPTQLCKYYFVNVVNLDFKMYQYGNSLIESFKDLIDLLIEHSFNKSFSISVESFAFQPSSLRFLFIDIEKLILEKGSLDEDKSFQEKMATDFLKSIKNLNMPILSSDLEILYEMGADQSQYPIDQAIEGKIQKTILSEKLFKNDKFTREKTLTLNFIVKKNTLDFQLTVGMKKRNFTFQNKNEKYMLFICNDKTPYNQCMIVQDDYVSGVNKKSMNFSNESYKDLKYDIEVQEANYNDGEESETKKKIFIVYFKLSKISYAKLSYKNLSFFDITFNPNENGKDIVMCETQNRKLIIGSINDFSTKKESFVLKNDIKVKKGNEQIYQIAPSVLDSRFEVCHQMHTKVYLIKMSDKQIILTSGGIRQELNSFTLRTIETEIPLLNLKECSRPLDNSDIQLDEDRRVLTYNGKEVSYPSQVVLRTDKSSQATIEGDCAFSKPNKTFLYRLENVSLEKSKLKWNWNFNSHENYKTNESQNSNVFLTSSENKSSAGFKFRNFVWPLNQPYIVFISIVFDSSSSKYKVKAGFYKDSKELYEIVPRYGDSIEFSTFPEDMTFNEKNAYLSTELNTMSFEKYDSVYMSETEVVYQLNTPNFKNCYPKLMIEKTKGLRIYCGPCAAFCDGQKMDRSQISHIGLKKVAEQAEPRNVINQGESENTGKKKSRVLI